MLLFYKYLGRMDNNKRKQHNLAIGQTGGGASSITPLACAPSEFGGGEKWMHDVFRTSLMQVTCACVCGVVHVHFPTGVAGSLGVFFF